jgi:tetratricopeptide (TPR) repeat protein
MTRRVLYLLIACTCLCSDLRASEQPPLEVTSAHFTVTTDANEKEARHILDNFERMRWMFQTLFPKTNVDPSSPILVMAMKNRRSLQAIEPEAYLANGQLNLAGLFLKTQDKNYVLMRMDAEGEHPFATVFHEYTHLQFSSAGEWMPLWLNEGIAEFFQNTDFREKEVVLGQASVDDILYLREHPTLPLTDLFRVDHNSPYYHQEDKASVFYAESWALTHYLQVRDREKGTNQVHDYMVLMSQHQDPVAAAEKAFGDLKQLQIALGFYIRQQQYKQFILSSAAAPLNSASYKVRNLSQFEYDARRADFMACVGRKKDALALLGNLLAADPKNAAVRETRGYLEMVGGNQDAAKTWYAEAVKLDSQSYLAHYYFAVLSLRTGNTDQDADIETSLRSAIRLNPSFAPAYDQLSSFYGMRHKNLDEAQNMSLKAIQLDRSNLGYRINAANLLAMRGDYDNAEKTLKIAVPLAKTPSEVSDLRGRQDQIATIRRLKLEAESSRTSVGGSVTVVTAEPSGSQAISVESPPRHPAEVPSGPKHTVIGTIKKVECSEPAVMDFVVEVTTKAGDKQVSLYTNDYFKLDLSALGFTPKGEMNPCKDIEGMKARVAYAGSSDKSVDGLAIAIELRQ